ncbi:hypothetical protein CFR77_13220 [Komagataeibacter sucrofermentans]|uniref:LHH domain-containing protein n=2 Tax=Komagataeibacter sucrofermentans TaxID=1053551 RepID=A0A318QEB8_9PROT|nr:hypothetical protein CFR77_13220 [Komagataeibacter sucrofermentans]
MVGGAVERAAEGALPITEAVNEEIKAAKESISLIAKEVEPVVKAFKLDKSIVGEIITALASMGEANVYAEEGLKGAKVGEHAALIRSDIDLQQIDPVRHWTNAQRMERGLPPLTKTGELVELHRIGQKPNGPFAELTVDVFGDIAKAGNLFVKATGAVTELADFGKNASAYWRDRINAQTKQN